MNRRSYERMSQFVDQVEPWWLLGVATLGLSSVFAGVFHMGGVSLGAGLIAVLVFGSTSWDIRSRLAETYSPRPFAEMEAPSLWVASTWIFMGLLGDFRAEGFIIAAALLGWLWACGSRKSAIIALALAGMMELALTGAGLQTATQLFVHFTVVGLAVWGLDRFASAEVFRTQLIELRDLRTREKDQQQRARDMGLLTAQAPILSELPSFGTTSVDGEYDSLAYIEESYTTTLKILRDGLDLNSAVLLWRGDAGWTMIAQSSVRDDLLQGPFPVLRGIPSSVLGEVSEVALEQVREGFAGLPYYESLEGVGSAFSIAIKERGAEKDDAPIAVLCADRFKAGSWTDAHRQSLRAAAQKITLDLHSSRQLKAAEHEKTTVRRFCAALGELNKALGIEEAAHATFEAVKEMANADLMVITLAGDNGMRVVAASGEYSDELRGLALEGQDNLVSKSLQVKQTLPLSGRYRGHGTVFTPGENLRDMKSLLVIPLVLPGETKSGLSRPDGGSVKEDSAIGALTVAARKTDAFEPPARDMIHLVARQIAIKLDLADAHEQIREMARTDAMTGLANERSFDHAFTNMLSRAQRRNDSVCLVMADIDKFKRLNDTYGHPFGDIVIKRVADILKSAIRSVDLAARIGGEEFALLLEDTDLDGAHELAERIRRDIESMTLYHDSEPIKLTMSMGIAASPEAGVLQSELVNHADKALYLAKNSGRNQVRTWRELENSKIEVVPRESARG